MKRILFVTQDLSVGGGTSSLSSLYNRIKSDYVIEVLLLTLVGEARVSYKERIILPRRVIDLYYRNLRDSSFFIKICVGVVKVYGRLFNFFSKHTFEEFLAKKEMSFLPSYDCIISYGEGIATSFSQYLEGANKVAWIHFDISRLPYNKHFEELYSRFNSIVVVSKIIANRFSSIYPALCDRIVPIHNIIDVDRIIEQSLEFIVQDYEDSVFNIVSIGRITPVKRFSEIPRIAAQLIEESVSFKWRIIGPATDPNELMLLEKNIIRYNVGHCVELMGNRLNPYPYLAKSDLCVILSITEACPMVITEARALNVPIVATDFSTAGEFIDDGMDGVICHFDELAISIAALLRNKSRYKSIRDKSIERGDSNSKEISRFKQLLD